MERRGETASGRRRVGEKLGGGAGGQESGRAGSSEELEAPRLREALRLSGWQERCQEKPES